MSPRASVFAWWWCVVGLLAACSEPETHRWYVAPPAAGVGGDSSAGAGAGGAGGAGGASTIDPVSAAGGNGGSTEPPMDAGAAGGQVAGQPALFDELAGIDPSRNDVPGDRVCERLATIQCAAEASCCAAPGRDFEACKVTMKQGCVDGLFLDQIMANPITDYDRARAAEVFAEYERLARQCDVNVATWAASNDGFRAFTRGTIAPGASCQPPAITLLPPGPGAAAAAHLFACTDPTTHACLPTEQSPWLCAPRAAEGGACFIDTNCSDGLFCTNSEERLIEGGTCNARQAEGAPCDLGGACLSFVCESGTCAPLTQQTIYCLQ